MTSTLRLNQFGAGQRGKLGRLAVSASDVQPQVPVFRIAHLAQPFAQRDKERLERRRSQCQHANGPHGSRTGGQWPRPDTSRSVRGSYADFDEASHALPSGRSSRLVLVVALSDSEVRRKGRLRSSTERHWWFGHYRLPRR